jgi:hypothetical protein
MLGAGRAFPHRRNGAVEPFAKVTAGRTDAQALWRQATGSVHAVLEVGHRESAGGSGFASRVPWRTTEPTERDQEEPDPQRTPRLCLTDR